MRVGVDNGLLIEPRTRGDPESPLRWTCKSVRRLADELTRGNHPVGAVTVTKLLRQVDNMRLVEYKPPR